MSRIVADIRANKPTKSPPDEAHWWRLVVPGNENFDTDPQLSDDGILATWTIPDGYENNIWPNGVHVHRVPDPHLPAMMSTIDPPKEWHVDVLAIDRPTPCQRWEELTQPGQHVHPNRTRPVTAEEQAADDERVLRLRGHDQQ